MSEVHAWRATASETGPGESRKIQDIERLRGLAILVVLFEHAQLSTALFQKIGLEVYRKPFWLGVELFFIISGYVVTKSFLSRPPSFRAFYLRRIFRLWPVLLMLFTLTALGNLSQIPWRSPWPALIKNAPLIPIGFYGTWNDPGIYAFGAIWSLSVEEQFYMVVPILLVGLSYLFGQPRRAAQVVMIAFFLTVGVVVRFGRFFGPQLGVLDPASIPTLLNYLDFKKFDFLALGVLLFFRMRSPNMLEWLGRRTSQVLIVTAVVAPFVAAGLLRNKPQWHECPYVLTFGLLGAGLCFYLVVGLASLDRDLLRFGHYTDRVMLYLGSRSYTLYVLHIPLFILCWVAAFNFEPVLLHNPWSYSMMEMNVFVLLGLPVVEVTYRYIERPGLRLGARLAARFHRRPLDVRPPVPAMATEGAARAA